MSIADLDALSWLEPWERVDAAQAASLARQLQRELRETHALYGRGAVAIAKHVDVDDVLFALSDPDELAVVHLAYKQPSSADAPSFMVFDSLNEFVEGCMQPDHLEYTDPDE